MRGEVLSLSPRTKENWAEGYFLQDKNKKIIYQWKVDFSGWEIVWSGFSSKNQLRIAPNPQTSAMNGHFLISNPYQHESVKLIVNRLGRIRKED